MRLLLPRLTGLLLLSQLIPAHGVLAEGLPAGGAEFFEKKIRPLLEERCLECHSVGKGKTKGGLALDSAAGWQKGGDNGPALVPGDVEKSLIINAVRYQNRDLQMPPKKALSSQQIKDLEAWVARGAPDPRSTQVVAGAATHHKPMGMSLEDGRNFWSFQPVGDPGVPVVKTDGWVKTPVDAFLLAQLEGQGLYPAPATDRRTLLRRVTFDLTGLPPTPEETADFLKDTAADAYPRVVERLLRSPQYGVRWGRHWLDVARYADSNGLDENIAYGQAWRYRDYVVNAFNEDKPFDRFVIEQMAGDLLEESDEPTRREGITATAFLSMGAKVLAEPDVQKLEMDIIDEQIDTMGKTFMGLTLGCARCHAHKFDPIPTEDYYALAAIFRSTKSLGDDRTGAIKYWYEHDFSTPQQIEERKGGEAMVSERKKAATAFAAKARADLKEKVRSQAPWYLAEAARFAPGTSLTEVARFAAPRGLHPRVLHHCRTHLAFHEDDPVFAKWRELAAVGNVEGIADHYGRLFDRVDQALATAKKADPKAVTLADPELESVRLALVDAAGFLAVPDKDAHALDAATLARIEEMSEQVRLAESALPDADTAMAVADGPIHARLPVHIRGSYLNLGTPVPRGFLQVMLPEGGGKPVFPARQSGRLQLARWLADDRNPLTARVMVNRLWGWHFGRGLVASTENFGVLGDRPSHPDLLDWLARRFMESGWSVKEMHRLLVLSSAYQMDSTHPGLASDGAAGKDPREVDPENRLLWRFPIQRLEAEQVRDALLAAGGLLDASLGGKTIPLRNREFVFNHTSRDHTNYNSPRRALYLPVIRNNVYDFFEQFDYPDPTMPTGSRNATVVAPQALLMMNSPFVMDCASRLADRVLARTDLDASGRIGLAYELATGRLPRPSEIGRVMDYLLSEPSALSVTGAPNPEAATDGAAWRLFCHSLLASNEFLYLR